MFKPLTTVFSFAEFLQRQRQRERQRQRQKKVSPVLEPNFDLPLCEAKLVSHLDPAAPCEVVVGVELLFQLQRLVSEPGICQILYFVFVFACICLLYVSVYFGLSKYLV